jgi:hypothetical protein
MKVVLISHPHLSLTSNLALHTLLPSRGYQPLTLRYILREVLRDETTLGQSDRLSICLRTSGRELNHRRLAQRMNLLEFWRGKECLLVAVEDL